MNASQFFTLLNETNDSYLAAAHKSMAEKPARAWFRPTLIAACLTLVLVAIPVGILIGNRTIKPSVPVITPTTTDNTVTTTQAPPITQPPPQTTEKPKASILDIPDAVLFDENDERFQTEGQNSAFSNYYSFTDSQKCKWIDRVVEENEVIAGYIQNATTVLVPDGKDYYQITTMEIAVLEDFSGIGKETVTAVYASKYKYHTGSYYPDNTYLIGDGINIATEEIREHITVSNDMFREAEYVTLRRNTLNHAGLILLKKAKNQTVTIEENTYALSDYSDFVLDACLYYELGSDLIYLEDGPILLAFPSGMFYERYFNLMTFGSYIGGDDNLSFRFEESYEAFDCQTALCLELLFANEKRFLYDSIFADELFINRSEPQNRLINPEYTWVVTIDGVKYEIKRFDLENYRTSTYIYLDLGAYFSFDLFDYNENNQYTYENMRLDIYDSEGNLLCYSPLTNNYRCPGGYTHTKPE